MRVLVSIVWDRTHRQFLGGALDLLGRVTTRLRRSAQERQSEVFALISSCPVARSRETRWNRLARRQQGNRTGSHPNLHTLVQTDMEIFSDLKAAAQGAARRPTRRLEHRTLGIRLRDLAGSRNSPRSQRGAHCVEVAGYLPLTALRVKAGGATIQHTSMHGEAFHSNQSTCPVSEGKPMEAFLRSCPGPTQKYSRNETSILKTHNRETMDPRSDCLRDSPRSGSPLVLLVMFLKNRRRSVQQTKHRDVSACLQRGEIDM